MADVGRSEKVSQKKSRNSHAKTISIVLVIIAMVIGILIGILIGLNANKGNSDANADGDGSDTLEIEEADEVVLTIGENDIMMSEINCYLYELRDEYIEEYGEEPWDIELDNGQTVSESAKEALYQNIVETQVLVQKADEYEIALTDEISASLADEVQEYIDTLGEDICEQFGVTASALLQNYEYEELSSEVYDAVWDNLYTEMQEEEEYSDLSDEDLESAVDEAYEELYEEWEAEITIETTDLWDTIIVGSVG